MAAAQYDFEIELGATVIKSFAWKDSAGVPIDLRGAKARMQARPSVASNEILLDATTENNKLQIHAESGTTSLVLSASESAALYWRKAKYDLEIEQAGGTVTRLVQGTITTSPEVTRG